MWRTLLSHTNPTVFKIRDADHCRILDMASFVNQPLFLRLLSLLILEMDLVIREMKISWKTCW